MIEVILMKNYQIAEAERTELRYQENETGNTKAYRQRCSGIFAKPPCGAVVKSNGTERQG